MSSIQLERLSSTKWRIPKSAKPGMLVDGFVYADEELLDIAGEEQAIEQVANVAFLPGIVKGSFAMPDIHWGYGFPIGGVAATDAEKGVISPGGVGYDISCGVRLMRTNMRYDEVKDQIEPLMYELGRNVPKGVGSRGKIKTNKQDMERILATGVKWAVKKGYAWPDDLDHIEEHGSVPGADPSKVSQRAYERGFEQEGTLGSGNHFLEVQEVIEIFDRDVAEDFGLFTGQLVVMIHSGSRGLGHQICTDYLKIMDRASTEYGINLPDRQLSCAPLDSEAGRDYLAAMTAAINYALANRQCLAYLTRQSFEYIFKRSAEAMGMTLLYDISHNTAKFETHRVDGEEKRVCVHRKGATRAFGPSHPSVPKAFRKSGQPVMIPGDMGRPSFILAGTDTGEEEAFASTCHGAGRLMSRAKARKIMRGQEVREELAKQGIIVVTQNLKALAEEASYAYKDASRVVEVCHEAGLSKKVAKVRPLGVVKG
jgi:tRNA-splicing ligase RtcB (3'-phosphate/5'-hydroxy nucleic acid ligase)